MNIHEGSPFPPNVADFTTYKRNKKQNITIPPHVRQGMILGAEVAGLPGALIGGLVGAAVKGFMTPPKKRLRGRGVLLEFPQKQSR